MSDKPALQILIDARAKIADPCNWGKGIRHNRKVVKSCCASQAIEESSSARMKSPRIKINIELHGEDAIYFDRMAKLAGMKRGGLARSIIETVIADDRAAHDNEPRLKIVSR